LSQLRAVFLMEKQTAELVHALARTAGLEISQAVVNSLDELEAAFTQSCNLLLSFGSSVIVPKHILDTPGLIALNVHAASPEFPGRDPHHFAVYYGAKQYGATLHYLTEKVDQGPIVDVELFPVPDGATPAKLLEKANEAGFELIKRFFKGYRNVGASISKANVSWGTRVTTRKDFTELCRIDPSMSESEFMRRLKATAMPGYSNLYIDIHGYHFRIERSVQ
jgi:methionyl-tRNA formyltransferase